jgi:hypothetical protein
MNCPGSVAAEAPFPNESSVYSREGTAAHELANRCLRLKQPAYAWLGESIVVTDDVDGKAYDILVTEEMCEAVQFYVDFVTKLFKGADEHGFEQNFDLSPFNPPPGMEGGTTDAWAFLSTPKPILIVADLKFGRGVSVTAEENWQTRYYLLGSWLERAKKAKWNLRSDQTQEFHAYIIQPRVLDADGNPMVTHEVLTKQEMHLAAKQLLDGAKATLISDAPRKAGGWCKFCRAKESCATFRNVALAVAQTEFSAIEGNTVALPAPGSLSPEQIGKVLAHRDLLREWLSSVEAYALAELERGRDIPGYARKPKEGHRKWADEAQTIAWAKKELKAEDDDLFDKSLKSPAQLEKALPKKTKIPGHLIVKPTTGWNLCRVDDPKAVTAAVDDFEALL